MEFGKFWDSEMRKQSLLEISEMEFYVVNKEILEQLKSFLKVYSDIEIKNKEKFNYKKVNDRYLITIKYEYRFLEPVIKEYIELLETNNLLEWKIG